MDVRSVYSRFVNRLERDGELPSNAHLRVAYSGGPDSTAAVILLRQYQEHRRPDLEVSLGHIHHGLRGDEADEDQRHCESIAETLGLPFTCTRVDVEEHAQRLRKSRQTAARELRELEFQRWGETGIDFVVLGHQADDDAETILGNLVRGAGLRGVRGIPTRRQLPNGPCLLRPLLDLGREELMALLESQDVSHREDSSNRSRAYRRNRIRSELMPLLAEFNPNYRDAIRKLGEDARVAHDWQASCLEQLRPFVEQGADAARVSRSAMLHVGEGIGIIPLFEELWQKLSGRPSGITRPHREAWADLVRDSGPGRSVDLPDRTRAERVADWLILWREPEVTSWSETTTQSLEVPSWGLRVAVSDRPESDCPSAPLPSGPLTFRPCRRGDRIRQEFGHADVNDMLRHRGLPRSLRQQYPVAVTTDPATTTDPANGDLANRDLANRQQVVWVPGLRSAWPQPSSPTAWGTAHVDRSASAAAFLIDCAWHDRGRWLPRTDRPNPL